MSNEAGLAKFFLGVAAVTLGTSTVTGVSCYYIGKKQHYEDAKPKTVYVRNMIVDKKEQQMLIVENYRAEKFGFIRQQDGTYKSIDQQLKEIEEEQTKIFEDIKDKME